jgi:hypothetical protein
MIRSFFSFRISIILCTCFCLFASTAMADCTSKSRRRQNQQNFLALYNYLHNRNNNVGPQGPAGPIGLQGPTGPAGAGANPFIADIGQTLTFDFTLPVTVGLIGDTVTAFITEPNGTTITGPTQTITLVGFAIPSITVANPIFGNYQAGVIVGAATATINTSVTTTATESRNGTVTALSPLPLTVGVLGARAQGSEPYGYLINPVP